MLVSTVSFCDLGNIERLFQALVLYPRTSRTNKWYSVLQPVTSFEVASNSSDEDIEISWSFKKFFTFLFLFEIL